MPPDTPPNPHPNSNPTRNPKLPPPTAGQKAPFPTALVVLMALVAVGGFVVYKQFLSMPVEAPPPPKKKKKNPKAAQVRDSIAQVAAAVEVAKKRADDDEPLSEEALEDAAAERHPDEIQAAYEFARVPWDKPGSKALAERVNRLDRGFDSRPRGRFHLVDGNQVFMRASLKVNPSADRKLDKIPESAIAEFLPEWYQRGFTLHFRGNFEPFSPMRFKLRELPAKPADTALPAKDRLVTYAVHAYVDRPEAVLIYPDESHREGANRYTDAAELKVADADSTFTAGYFRNLTRGRVESIRTYAFPDRPWRLMEVSGRRDVPVAAGDMVRNKKGTWIFLVKPEEKEIAFVVHSFDSRLCLPEKDIRFRAVLDLAGDESGELLLGPKPAVLVHEDAEGIKYHYEEGLPCRPAAPKADPAAAKASASASASP